MKQTDHQPMKPPVLGIVGGLASGKSTVAGLLAERGARVVDADRIGHQVLESPRTRQVLEEAFGKEILDESGRVCRRRLAEKAFGHPEAVEKLNSIVHPLIIREVRAQVGRLKRDDGVPLVVLDAPLLMETHLHDELCQALLFVDAPQELRQRRALSDQQMSADQYVGRQEAQLPVELKQKEADYKVNNTGSLKELERQIEQLWPELCRTTRDALDRAPPAKA